MSTSVDSTSPATLPQASPAKVAAKPSLLPKLVLAVLVLAIIAWMAKFAWHLYAFEATDDAYVVGHIHQVSPQLAGRVIEVLVQDNQPVKAGDVLLRLDPLEYQIALQKAQAGVAQSEAQQSQAIAAASQAAGQLAEAEAKVAQAKAQQAQAKAQYELAKLSHARQRAALPGWLGLRPRNRMWIQR